MVVPRGLGFESHLHRGRGVISFLRLPVCVINKLGLKKKKNQTLNQESQKMVRVRWGSSEYLKMEVTFLGVISEVEVVGKNIRVNCEESETGQITVGCPYSRKYYDGHVHSKFEVEISCQGGQCSHEPD